MTPHSDDAPSGATQAAYWRIAAGRLRENLLREVNPGAGKSRHWSALVAGMIGADRRQDEPRSCRACGGLHAAGAVEQWRGRYCYCQQPRNGVLRGGTAADAGHS